MKYYYDWMIDVKQARLEQRRENFSRAINLLSKQSEKEVIDDENIAATLHFFEMAFELAWKLLKDYLEIQGVIVNSPREVIKKSFQLEYIDDGVLWLEMLDARNSISHMYEESMAKELFLCIKERFIFPLLKVGELKCRD
ncbi:MAG: nucleotidyltransferase substrate binding protein [Clostridiales bacterium]|jgi:nucleotidyltransferase substrate binding protein (TIGR01987 family)|nr:nucleotidyltransferase substrate binding protein [Clostridiales bacterium]